MGGGGGGGRTAHFLNPSPNTEHSSQNAKSKTAHIERTKRNSTRFFSGKQIVLSSQE